MEIKERDFKSFLDEGIDEKLLEKDELILKKVNNYKKRRQFLWLSWVAIFILLIGFFYFEKTDVNKQVIAQRGAQELNTLLEKELKEVESEVNLDYQLVNIVDELEYLEKISS